MNNRTCTGCGNEFTPTHGRQRCCSIECRKPTHAMVTLTCDCCGGPAVKYKQARRYARTYCSLLCRDYERHGASTCTIPSDHWSRWFGRSSEWKPPLIRNDGTCAWCEQPNARGWSASYCSPDCSKRAQRVRRRAKLHNASGTYTYGQLVRLWLAFGKSCAYCRQATPLADIQAEHVVPLARDGSNHLGNILPSCGPCNSDKRDLLLEAWSDDRARRGLAPRVTSWSAHDRRYSHLTLTLAA